MQLHHDFNFFISDDCHGAFTTLTRYLLRSPHHTLLPFYVMNPSLQRLDNGKKVPNGQQDDSTIDPTDPNTLSINKN